MTAPSTQVGKLTLDFFIACFKFGQDYVRDYDDVNFDAVNII